MTTDHTRDHELANLRRWKAEATEVLDGWDQVFDALGRPGGLGELQYQAALAAVQRLTRAVPADTTINLPEGAVEACRLTIVSYLASNGASDYAVSTRGSAHMLTYLGMTVIAQDHIKEWGQE